MLISWDFWMIFCRKSYGISPYISPAKYGKIGISTMIVVANFHDFLGFQF